MNNIDNVIGSTELFDAEWENTVKAQAKYYAKDCEDVSKNITFYPVEWIGRGICNIIGYGNLRRFTGYRDGRGGVNQIDNSMLPLSKSTDLVKLFTDCANFSKPANSYLHYIMSADLSKEQLEEILNKINSSSVSVQSQLVEIKEVIVEKLKNLS